MRNRRKPEFPLHFLFRGAATCATGGLFYSNIFRILKEKLDRRNIVAHPSNVLVVQSQADDVDLINNVVLALV